MIETCNAECISIKQTLHVVHFRARTVCYSMAVLLLQTTNINVFRSFLGIPGTAHHRTRPAEPDGDSDDADSADRRARGPGCPHGSRKTVGDVKWSSTRARHAQMIRLVDWLRWRAHFAIGAVCGFGHCSRQTRGCVLGGTDLWEHAWYWPRQSMQWHLPAQPSLLTSWMVPDTLASPCNAFRSCYGTLSSQVVTYLHCNTTIILCPRSNRYGSSHVWSEGICCKTFSFF